MQERHIFMGYDERQEEFYKLSEYSIKSTNLTGNVTIHPLKHQELRRQGLFNRPWQIEGNTGQFIDMVDNKPFSTQFSHSRFIVPELAKKQGLKGLVMFVDCDFIFNSDVELLFQEIEQEDPLHTKAVYVVKHEYNPSTSIKMDNKQQTVYEKKLWSSLMVFNLDHKENNKLNKNLVNTAEGRYLHTFKWLSDDNLIGNISESWNWIPDHSEEVVPYEQADAVHFTEGSPLFKGYETCSYAELYNDTKQEYLLDQYLESVTEYNVKIRK